MEVNEQLVRLARTQQANLKNLMVRLFDKSSEGLHRTKAEVVSLRNSHAWYHSNIYQIRELKRNIERIQQQYDATISRIIQEIREERERAKQALLNALRQLETTMNTDSVKQHLNALIGEIDKLLDNMSTLVLLGPMLSALGFGAIITAIIGLFSGASVLGFVTLGLGGVVSAATSEVIFRRKLSELENKLGDDIQQLALNKSQRLQQLDTYFDGFEQKLRHGNNSNPSIDIVWFDTAIENNANQSFARQLSQKFQPEKYRVIPFNNKLEVIQCVQGNIASNLILITSGSAGEGVISEIGHYWNIKGIILYCMQVEHHRSWAHKYKKVLLVTNNSDEIVEKIKRIECGDVYFLTNGFSLEDVTLKLQNADYYLSSKAHGFMISHIASINLDLTHHTKIMGQLHGKIESKKLYPNGIPNHFKLENLNRFVNEFIQVLRQSEPEKKIITLYTKEMPYYYKIINDILNRLDQELIELAGDYIKALRYALLMYLDGTDKVPSSTNVKLYRGLCLKHQNSFQEFQRKFSLSDVIIFPSFLSTSLDKAKAESFTGGKGVILEISADCTQMNKPKNVAAVSSFPSENEVLLNCFSILTVQSIRKQTNDIIIYECTLELK